MNVLLVEDERRIAEFVSAGLKEQGFRVSHFTDGKEGLHCATTQSFDVILLDIMVPGMDGLSILKQLRRQGSTTPVILLTARNELDDRLEGLNLGADDYLAKPFFVEELTARIHALLRRASGTAQNHLTCGSITLNRMTREVHNGDQAIELTGREFNLLEYLMRSPGRVFTRTQILEHVWGYDFDPQTNVVDVSVRRLRKKLEQTGVQPIEAVRGVGYRLLKQSTGD